MSILVAFASKYGATQGIAERIAEKLRAAGLEAEARPAKAVGDIAGCDAFVIGSAAYMGSWLKEATEFVRRNSALLSERPVWLFSSGPLGSEKKDAQGRDLREVAVPKEIAELSEAVRPRGHRVFFGALDRGKLGFAHRMVALLPASSALLPEGDCRDWKEIDIWAESIAEALTNSS